MIDILNRLSRRGILTITAEDGMYEVRFKAPGPYGNRGWCSTDEADLFQYCHLGASDWRGEGADLAELIHVCFVESAPRERVIDDLVWDIEQRRNSRTYGPPLPTYRRWYGWTPGQERWLRTAWHGGEYLGGYRRDLAEEQDHLNRAGGVRVGGL